jgi:hypothetical protein
MPLLLQLPDVFFFAFFTFTAQASTASTYRPILIGINAVYILLIVGYSTSSSSSTFSFVYGIWGTLGMSINAGLQYYSYLGILEASTNTPSSNKSKKDLVGGINLDLLGLTVFVQFATILHTAKWFWLLLIVPVYALYTLYTTVYGGAATHGGGNRNKNVDSSTAEAPSSASSKEQQDRRQKRAEKRKQKWG